MIEIKSDLTPKKIALVTVLAVAVVAAILFQIFWTPDKSAVSGKVEIKKQKFLANLLDPQMGILYSLDPASAGSADGFRGYKILDEAKLSPEDLSTVSLEFKEAVDSYNESLGSQTCFNPVMGLRVVKDGKTTDFLMSYDCLTLKAFGDGVEYSYGAAGTPAKLNDILKAADNPIDSNTVEPLE